MKGKKMPKWIRIFVHMVDRINTVVGKFSMYLVFLMIGILLYEPVARKLFDQSCIWAVEMSQFTMAAYYLLGGGYSMILRGHVHYLNFCGGPGWLAMTLPALQMKGSKYGVRQCSGVVDFGFTVFDVGEDGRYTWWPELADIKSQRARALRV